MLAIRDYQIVRRENGYARVYFAGEIPEEYASCERIQARVSCEDDGFVVVDWCECERVGNRFSVELVLPEGGLYRLDAAALVSKDADAHDSPCFYRVRHVGVGELFMLTGQSNMAGYGREAAYDPPELGVHLYANDGNWRIAAHPLNDACNSIYPENLEPNTASSPALSFARTARRLLNVPIGLVQASRGCTQLCRWHPEEDGDLYRAMLRRLDAVGPVSGVLWYQGCADAKAREAPIYFERFVRMLELWRKSLGDVPMITVQLNRVVRRDSEWQDRCWGNVREAQRQAAQKLNNVYIVPAMDLAMSDVTHNNSAANVILGERMANAYLRGKRAPNINRIRRVDDARAMLIFDEPCVFKLINNDQPPLGFDIEDESGLIPCVRVAAKDGGLIVTAGRSFAKGARMHAFWQQMPEAGVPYALNGLPMLAFYNVPVEE